MLARISADPSSPPSAALTESQLLVGRSRQLLTPPRRGNLAASMDRLVWTVPFQCGENVLAEPEQRRLPSEEAEKKIIFDQSRL